MNWVAVVISTVICIIFAYASYCGVRVGNPGNAVVAGLVAAGCFLLAVLLLLK